MRLFTVSIVTAGLLAGLAGAQDDRKAVLEVNGKKIDQGKKLDEAFKEASELLEANKLYSLKRKGYELSIIGESDVNGKPAVGMRVVKEGQKDMLLYFDKKSSLMVKTERRIIDPMAEQEMTEERIITEFEPVQGVPHPKKLLINRDGKKFLEAEI